MNSNLSLLDAAIAKARHAEQQRSAAQSSSVKFNKEGQGNLTEANSIASSSKAVQEIWKWTMTAAAVASCFVRDALEMKECDEKGVEFFWLGRVPCRSVRLVGLIVGVQTYEKKTIYTVDDGSAVIDCNYRHSTPPTADKEHSPKKLGVKSSTKPYSKAASSSKVTVPRDEHHVVSRSALSVGMSVRVVGRLMKWHDTRIISVDTIEQCTSSNDEPNHWLAVCDLHQTYFSPSIGPFSIPQPVQATQPRYTISNVTQPRNERRPPIDPPATAVPNPQTPSRSSVTSSTHSSPISEASTSGGAQSPIRLRHPSRLRTRDLTANTFRIYLKHYMDNAPQEDDESCSSADDDSDYRGLEQSFPKTPTKRSRASRSHTETFGDATPRPRGPSSLVFATPRASMTSSHTVLTEDPTGSLRGYTLSHLRRVPELRLMAHRVVRAEAKRRAQEERLKIKESQSQDRAIGKPQSSSSSGSRGPGKGKDGESTAPKMKRLFRFAIRQLFEEGGIVLWDGPVRSLPDTQHSVPSLLSFVSASSSQNRLWKGDATKGDSTMFSSASGSSQAYAMNDSGDISDPPPGEESYIPLTTPYLSRIVEQTIAEIMSQPLLASSSSVASKLWNITVSKPTSRAGPTPAEILDYLHRRDERWARVGEWAIKDALDWSKENGRVWCIGNGRWELCG